MQEQHLFEYAIIRVVPRVEREEFLNVGVILYCKKLSFLKTVFVIDEARLMSLHPAIDLTELQRHLHAFERISDGDISAGPIGKLDMASRFRWLTAKRSTVVQTSGVHPGLCTDAAQTLAKLQQQLVLC